jgi:hypothetical protein
VVVHRVSGLAAGLCAAAREGSMLKADVVWFRSAYPLNDMMHSLRSFINKTIA